MSRSQPVARGTFKIYGETGGGKKRYYLHSPEEVDEHNTRLGTSLEPGQFTHGKTFQKNRCPFFEGLHGGVEGDGYNVLLC